MNIDEQNPAGRASPENGQTEESPSLTESLSELEILKTETAELLDRLQRSQAEFANYRRRVTEDNERQKKLAAERLLLKLLYVEDDFERALAAIPAEQLDSAWVEGIRLVQRKFWGVLDSEGVQKMESVGQPFDPTVHEAIMVDEHATAANTVIGEAQRGYLLHNAVLRPAMVMVGSADQVPGESTNTN